MQTNIEIPEIEGQSMALELSKLLADEFLLSTKTRNAHWNVEGLNFHAKQKLFKSQYDQLDKITDSVAERIRSIGHYATTSLSTFLKLTHLTEARNGQEGNEDFITELVSDHESIVVYLREIIQPISHDISQSGTANFLNDLIEEHKKMVGFLRSNAN